MSARTETRDEPKVTRELAREHGMTDWEYEHMLVHGLKALAPYASSNVHAKYWDRWGDRNDVQRSTRIMLAGGFKGTFALEYEQGPLNGVDGALFLYKEVLTALTTPTPVTG